MKKSSIYILISFFAFVSCKNEVSKDYVSLSGTFKNIDFDQLDLRKYTGKDGSITTINFNSDGTFSDTLKLEEGEYFFTHPKKDSLPIILYLKNGDNIKVNYDVKGNEYATYEGTGIEASVYMEARRKKVNDLVGDKQKFVACDSIIFYKKLELLKKEINALVYANKHLGTTFTNLQEEYITYVESTMIQMHNDAKAKNAFTGKPAPKFFNYENYAGGLTSLDDLKGKYVFIDMWATWCIPCIGEFPALKELEKLYHAKNIEFVSISIDKPSKYKAWKTMVTEMKLTGIQLIVPQNSSIMSDYSIQAIPRFIIIDPQGNLVNINAPRPSSNEIRPLLDKLLNP